MAIQNRSLVRSPMEYSQKDEDRFRRDLERQLFEISSVVERISNGSDTAASLQSKRENLLVVPAGFNVY